MKGCVVTFGRGVATFYDPGGIPFMRGTWHNNTMYRIDFVPTAGNESFPEAAIDATDDTLDITTMSNNTAALPDAPTETRKSMRNAISSLISREAQTTEDHTNQGTNKKLDQAHNDARSTNTALVTTVSSTTPLLYPQEMMHPDAWKPATAKETMRVGYPKPRTNQSARFRKVGDEITIAATSTNDMNKLSKNH
ncbi:hypothetical protein C0991_005829 [Blastosporella zonata]|nr:hypothetical protein C0991_005829 [Blastosporella zonata]